MFKLKELRIKAGLNQSEVADFLNISRSMYSYIETGKSALTFENAIRLSKLFKCSLNDLAGIKEDIVLSRKDFDKLKNLSSDLNEIINKYDK